MTRRIVAATFFAVLGFVSFWWWTGIDEQLCRHFPGICIPPQGVCAELGKCGMPALKIIELALVICGPAFVFGMTAAIFSRRPRGWVFWPALAMGLVLLHWAIMAGVRLA